MPPRRFPYSSVLKNGRHISGQEFVDLARSQKYRSAYEEPFSTQAFADNLNLNVLLEGAGLIPPPP
jgi:hypothetical protein